MPDRRRVLIVGGGIAGLALAPMLTRIGVAVDVIEREPAWRPAGTGIYLPGNAARALRVLGLEAQVASRAVEITRQRFYDHHGRLLCEVDVAELWAAVGRASRNIGPSCTGSFGRRLETTRPNRAGCEAPRPARRHRLSRVQRRDERRIRSRRRGGRDTQRRAPADV
jgi:glycine/D-amino acid oxidase-like deaminating enzyme